jgi:hypothetical protein
MQPYSSYTNHSSSMELSETTNANNRNLAAKRKFGDLSGAEMQSWPKIARFNECSAKECFADTSKLNAEIKWIYQQIVTKQITDPKEITRAHCRITRFLKLIEENENISFIQVMKKYYIPLKTEFGPAQY